MRRWSQKRSLRLVSEISVTPLLDLVLVLLLVFMVAVPLMKKEEGLTLPATIASSGMEGPKEQVALTMASDESLALDDKALAAAELPAQLKSLVAARPDIGVIVRIDRHLPVQRLVEIMDLLRVVGVKHTAVAASPMKKN